MSEDREAETLMPNVGHGATVRMIGGSRYRVELDIDSCEFEATWAENYANKMLSKGNRVVIKVESIHGETNLGVLRGVRIERDW